jgi:hypothetical protein
VVEIRVNDLSQITLLECRLRATGVECLISKDDGRYGLPTPYLIADGTPIDEQRAYKWIEERYYE